VANIVIAAGSDKKPLTAERDVSVTTITNQAFLANVFGSEWENAHVTGFPEAPQDLEKLELRHYWAGNRWSRWPSGWVNQLPDWNSYFSVSLFRDDRRDGRARRRRDLFVSCHVILVDDVGTKVDGDYVRDRVGNPTYALETSPGNFQWGYVLDPPETDPCRVEALVDVMIASGMTADGKDPGMSGVNRYARLPQGVNTKKVGEPWSHVLHGWAP
jgi:hypothetical protein